MRTNSEGKLARRLETSVAVLAILAAAAVPASAAAPPAAPAAGAFDADLLAGLAPRSIGPAGMSGRIAAIAAVESNPDIVYAGAATGGVWKSFDGGVTWKPIFDDQPVAAIGAIAIDRRNPSIVWVGTGEGNVRNSASVGNGIYRSLDGGETWTHLGLDGSERIHRIVLHPDDSDVAWVAALGREWGENPERGIFKTTDGGRTWQQGPLRRREDRRRRRRDRRGRARTGSSPRCGSTGAGRYFFKSGGPGSGLYSSLDGGETWQRLEEEDGLPAGELGRIGIALSRSHPEIVYAMVEAEKSALLRSDDGGRELQDA